jgi:hypothetical protein
MHKFAPPRKQPLAPPQRTHNLFALQSSVDTAAKVSFSPFVAELNAQV